MTGRKGMWAIGGALAAATALVASEGTYRRLRRLAGLETDRGYYEEAAPETLEAEPVDTREARLSLRARLAESSELVESEAAAPRARRPERVDHDPERRAVDDARERVLARARAAASDQG